MLVVVVAAASKEFRVSLWLKLGDLGEVTRREEQL